MFGRKLAKLRLHLLHTAVVFTSHLVQHGRRLYLILDVLLDSLEHQKRGRRRHQTVPTPQLQKLLPVVVRKES